MKFSVDVVKYRDMPGRQWYMSSGHSDWYYHSERVLPSQELSPKVLEATLDPPLRLLALGLNSLGYTTLPSCSGHYKKPEELHETYSSLIKDGKEIRGTGLQLRDVETGDVTLLKDKSWYLPWDRTTFIKSALGTDGKPEGYLGFCVPRGDAYKVGKSIEGAVAGTKGCRYEVKRHPIGYIFELRVHTGKQRTQDRAWQDLGDSLMLNLVG